MRRFLPSPAPGVDYTITGNTTGFSTEPWAILRNLGLNMNVSQARTETRIPSPVSRAYVFYSNLHGLAFGTDPNEVGGDGQASDERLSGQGRLVLQTEARRTLRGLLSAFALRQATGVSIKLEAIYINAQQDAVSDVLRVALESAPGGEAFWNPMRIFKAALPGQKPFVIGGLSPLTGIFPAASPAASLQALYWYDPSFRAAEGAKPVGRWYDPTSDELSPDRSLRVSNETSSRVRALMSTWLQRVLSDWQPGALASCGLGRRDESALKREFELWLRDLGHTPSDEVPEARQTPLEGGDSATPFFLNWTCGGLGERIASDFAMSPEGRFMVTEEDLQKPRLRLYGRQFGALGLEQAAARLQARGDNLGRDLGLGELAAPMPYVCIDRLFTPHLMVLTSQGFSPEWQGLEVDEQGSRFYGLYPFEPSILEVVSRELITQTKAWMAQDGQTYFVELPLEGGRSVTKRYSLSGGALTLDGTVPLDQYDLRLFPNVDLDKVHRHLPRLSTGDVPDDVYYARVRLMPEWNFRTVPIDAQGNSIGRESILGSEAVPAGADRAPGRAAFYEIRGARPAGFYLENRGLCFLQLRDPAVAGRETEEWTVGVDFGTSNTCVSYARSDNGRMTSEPDVLELPVFTTTLLRVPNYSNVDNGTVNEGASAVLDFFTRFGERDTLNPDGFFPSQMLTQQPRVSDEDRFQLSNGVAFFENLCLTDPKFLIPVQPFPVFTLGPGQPRLAKRFSLKRDIKWDQQAWLRTYLQHLRKQITLTAAVKGACVKEVRFSYPRSFGYSKWNTYLNDFKRAWSDGVAGQSALAVRIQQMTESEASQGQLVQNNQGYVVFDVGGGTSDITGYSTGAPAFQTSIRLAGGALNRYVSSAPQLRKRLLEALKENEPKTHALLEGALGEWFCSSAATDSASVEVTESLWLAVLQSLERQGGLEGVLTHLRNSVNGDSPEDRAVKGFFMTAALFFGGLAYLGGALMRMATTGMFEKNGGAFSVPRVQLELTGNGAKLFRMLGDGDHMTFSPVLVNLFRRGYQRVTQAGQGGVPDVNFDGMYRFKDKVAPKVSVALGLLQTTPGRNADIPVSNVVVEEGWDAGASAGQVESDVMEYYQHVRANKRGLKVPERPAPLFQDFLEAVNQELPYGRLAQKLEVIPRVGANWHSRLLEEALEEFRAELYERLLATAESVEDYAGVPDYEKPAFEPVFAAELAALLEAVRKHYAS